MVEAPLELPDIVAEDVPVIQEEIRKIFTKYDVGVSPEVTKTPDTFMDKTECQAFLNDILLEFLGIESIMQ